MAYSEGLADRVRRAVKGRRGFVEKRLFGGLGFMLQGKLCAVIWNAALVVRLDPADARKALGREHVAAFAPGGKSMKGWLLVSPEGIDTDAELSAWVEQAIEFVRTLE